MSRNTRAELGQRALSIIEHGSYQSRSGAKLDIAADLQRCVAATELWSEPDLLQLRQQLLQQERRAPVVSRIEVRNETTLAGAARMLAESAGPVLVLNFASAKNPGGGFLSGSQAQEESLARSSGLYASQMQAWDFYERHRANSSCLYSHAMIYSPACPVFADDDGHLLNQTQLLSFITSAAPNAGAVASNHAHDLPLVPVVLKERAELVLTLARAKGYQRLLLGAWGCGVFRNDPQMVARSFTDLLRSPAWDGQFAQVLFSVLDHSREQATFRAFQKACDGAN